MKTPNIDKSGTYRVKSIAPVPTFAGHPEMPSGTFGVLYTMVSCWHFDSDDGVWHLNDAFDPSEAFELLEDLHRSPYKR